MLNRFLLIGVLVFAACTPKAVESRGPFLTGPITLGVYHSDMRLFAYMARADFRNNKPPELVVVNVDSRKESRIPRSNLVYSMEFSPNGKWLALGDYEGQVFIYETATLRLVHVVRVIPCERYCSMSNIFLSNSGAVIIADYSDEKSEVFSPMMSVVKIQIEANGDRETWRSDGFFKASLDAEGNEVLIQNENGIHRVDTRSGQRSLFLKGEHHLSFLGFDRSTGTIIISNLEAVGAVTKLYGPGTVDPISVTNQAVSSSSQRIPGEGSWMLKFFDEDFPRLACHWRAGEESFSDCRTLPDGGGFWVLDSEHFLVSVNDGVAEYRWSELPVAKGPPRLKKRETYEDFKKRQEGAK